MHYLFLLFVSFGVLFGQSFSLPDTYKDTEKTIQKSIESKVKNSGTIKSIEDNYLVKGVKDALETGDLKKVINNASTLFNGNLQEILKIGTFGYGHISLQCPVPEGDIKFNPCDMLKKLEFDPDFSLSFGPCKLNNKSEDFMDDLRKYCRSLERDSWDLVGDAWVDIYKPEDVLKIDTGNKNMDAELKQIASKWASENAEKQQLAEAVQSNNPNVKPLVKKVTEKVKEKNSGASPDLVANKVYEAIKKMEPKHEDEKAYFEDVQKRAEFHAGGIIYPSDIYYELREELEKRFIEIDAATLDEYRLIEKDIFRAMTTEVYFEGRENKFALLDKTLRKNLEARWAEEDRAADADHSLHVIPTAQNFRTQVYNQPSHVRVAAMNKYMQKESRETLKRYKREEEYQERMKRIEIAMQMAFSAAQRIPDKFIQMEIEEILK